MTQFKSPLGTKRVATTNLKEFNVSNEENGNNYSNAGKNIPIDKLNELMASRGMPPVNLEELTKNHPQQQESVGRFQATNDYFEEEVVDQGVLSMGAKKRIDYLIGLTRMTKDVDVGDSQFSLRTLKSKELKAATLEAAKYSDTLEFPFQFRRHLLSYSLFLIDGNDVAVYLGDSSQEAVLEFLDELDESLVNALYAHYVELSVESSKKYAIKTQNDVKEVVEDLKK